MKNLKNELSNEVKLTTFAKSIYNESIELGFKSNDYVKLMNELLDMTITQKNHSFDSKISNIPQPNPVSDLPIMTKNLMIRYYDAKTDKKIVTKWFNDPNNNLFLVSALTNDSLTIDHIENSNHTYAMICLKNSEPIGMLALLNIDESNSKAEMRKLIGELKYRGQGYAKEATSVWLKYCTEYKNLDKIYIYTTETNIRNVSINRQLGFQLEGLMKKEFKVDNVSHDVLRMAYFKR